MEMDERFPRLLIIDHADSYTLNLVPLLIRSLPHISPVHILARCIVVSHTDPRLAQILPHVDALILGPGPGHPSHPADFGASLSILQRMLQGAGEFVLPTLGICLGHQGLAVAMGGQVERAPSIRHGVSSRLELLKAEGCRWGDIFEGLEGGKIDVIRYNSLTVVESSLRTVDLRTTAISDDDGERVVMGLQHSSLPLWGVQFHPESICSGRGGAMVANFVRETNRFWATAGAVRKEAFGCELPDWARQVGRSLVEASLPLPPPASNEEEAEKRRFRVVSRRLFSPPGSIGREKVFEKLFREKGRSVWLDGSRHGDPQSRFSYMAAPSFSLSYNVRLGHLALSQRNRPRKTLPFSPSASAPGSKTKAHEVNEHGLPTPMTSRSASPASEETSAATSSSQETFWTFLDALQKQLQAQSYVPREDDEQSPPFKTGFVGYFSYEMKDESLPSSPVHPNRKAGQEKWVDLPTANFGFCNRVLAFDDERQEWTAYALLLEGGIGEVEYVELAMIQEALEEDNVGLSLGQIQEWFDEVQRTIHLAGPNSVAPSFVEKGLPRLLPLDDASTYIEKVEECRRLISQGQSYELCLTTRFRGEIDGENKEGDEVAWSTYKSLRQRNPAPYSAYMELDDSQKKILSTSPERFMSMSRDGRISMKPIKGTLARAGFKAGDHEAMRASGMEEVEWKKAIDEKRRRALEADPKERAENLMRTKIVDLIRNDLVSFCDPASVVVPRLMVVESYESVHQLVTTVSALRSRPDIGPTECLRRSFPPGSMTGAPKKRSCELLDQLEGGVDRGIYAGILGWIGVDGAATFSVVIRTACFDGSRVEVGAGGAVTYLSEPAKEWREALDKVESIASVKR